MSSTIKTTINSDAEVAYKLAFDRLKIGETTVLPKGAPITQNNVAREAGRDPSALKKSRFPSLVAEIQRWVNEHPVTVSTSPRQLILAGRAKSRTYKEKIAIIKSERDLAMSILVEADSRILELMLENSQLKESANIKNMYPRKLG